MNIAKFGKIKISPELWTDLFEYDQLKYLFEKFYPVRIEHDPYNNNHIYYGYCEDFSEVGILSLDDVPLYDCIFHVKGNAAGTEFTPRLQINTVSFQKLKS